MKRLTIIALAAFEAVALVGLGGCFSEPALTKDEAMSFDAEMKGYYQNPDSQRMIAILPRLSATLKEWGAGAVPPICGFYYGAARKSPDADRLAWTNAMESCRNENIASSIKAGLSGYDLSRCIPESLEDYSPSMLDFLWGYFFATGDVEAVRRIIRRATMTVPEPKGCETIIDLTARAAQWSLLAIGRTDVKVCAELEDFALTADEKDVRAVFGAESYVERTRMFLSAKAVERIERTQPAAKPAEKN